LQTKGTTTALTFKTRYYCENCDIEFIIQTPQRPEALPIGEVS
jgi:hypothetical protein